MRGLVFLAVAACGSDAARPTGPISAKAESSTADRLYLESTRLDYRAPEDRSSRHHLRTRAVLAYVQDCAAGDRRACWRAPMVAFGIDESLDDRHVQEAAIAVANACLAGDNRSCDALADVRASLVRREHARYTMAFQLCNRGLGAACGAIADAMSVPHTTPEGIELYQRACKLGDSMSCTVCAGFLENADPWREREDNTASAECKRSIAPGCRHLAEGDPDMRARAAEVLLAGCRAGVVGDCDGEATPDEPSLRHEMLTIACPARGDGCEELAKLHAPDGKLPDPIAERDALEQACQHDLQGMCVALVGKYESHALTEPVPNRAASLRAYLCKHPGREIPRDFCK